jgi:hypothetical protein
MAEVEDSRFDGPALAISAAALVICAAAAFVFTDMWTPEPILSGPGVTSRIMLGERAPAIAGTPGDTPIFTLTGAEPGGTLMLMGGTHPREISGVMAAIIVVEHASVRQGRVIVVPQSNRSGFTHTEALDAFTHTFTIDTPGGPRWFRVGARMTNPVDQWPDPDVYVHRPTGEGMIGLESRNLNRNYPGQSGSLTAQVSKALLDLVIGERVDVLLDMHESSPEGTIANTMVAHERAFETAAYAISLMQENNVAIDLEASPRDLHGLTHREFGDHTQVQAMLTETDNPAQGRLRGRFDDGLLIDGIDANYVVAARLGKLYTPYDQNGHPLAMRVARQIEAIRAIINAYNELNPANQIVVDGLPGYEELIANGIGAYLLPPP